MFLNIFFDFNQGTPIKLTYKNNGILTIINKKARISEPSYILKSKKFPFMNLKDALAMFTKGSKEDKIMIQLISYFILFNIYIKI